MSAMASIDETKDGPHEHAEPADKSEGYPELATNAHWRGVMQRARKERGLKQEDLGLRVGVSQNVISRIESGIQAASSAVIPICNFLKIPPPIAMFDDELDQRWHEAGRRMRARNPEMFAAQVAAMEAFAASLSGPREH